MSLRAGPTWVMWGDPLPEVRAGPADEANARQVLVGCQGVVDAELTSDPVIVKPDSDEEAEIARFTDWLRSFADPDTLAPRKWARAFFSRVRPVPAGAGVHTQ